MSAIDYNRGVTAREEPASGVRVYMYKDAPGLYYDAHGHEVSEKLARRAGFNVPDLRRERLKRDAIKKSMDEIEASYEQEKREKKEKIIKEEGGYKIVERAFGRCWVIGPDNAQLSDKPLTREEAKHVFKEIVNTPMPDEVE